jgi:hypothetical protein
MEFLRKHYEKILLCVVLLGLAAATVWMKAAIDEAQRRTTAPPEGPTPAPSPRRRTGAPVAAAARAAATNLIDLSEDVQAMAQMTNPPMAVLSGAHNLFNPVTWKRKSNGDLFKVLKAGPDALIVSNIIPLYTIVNYDHPSGDGVTYVMSTQQHIEEQQAGTAHKTVEYVKKDQKPKSGLYIIRGTKGAEEAPTELNLEIPQTGETNVWISTNNPYKRVDSHLVDLKYDPETKVLLKQKVDDWIKLENEPYKIVEITNNAVRIQSSKSSKVTEIKWTESQKRE